MLMYTVQFVLCANKEMHKKLITVMNCENSTCKKIKWLPCKWEKEDGGGGQ